VVYSATSKLKVVKALVPQSAIVMTPEPDFL
jgi:hypothetical protein